MPCNLVYHWIKKNFVLRVLCLLSEEYSPFIFVIISDIFGYMCSISFFLINIHHTCSFLFLPFISPFSPQQVWCYISQNYILKKNIVECFNMLMLYYCYVYITEYQPPNQELLVLIIHNHCGLTCYYVAIAFIPHVLVFSPPNKLLLHIFKIPLS